MRRLLLLLACLPAATVALPVRNTAHGNVSAARIAEANAGLKPANYRNRSFDPATGRFLQRDPVLGGDPMLNPYCFPGNNPVSNMDPMGEDWKWEKGQWVEYLEASGSNWCPRPLRKGAYEGEYIKGRPYWESKTLPYSEEEIAKYRQAAGWLGRFFGIGWEYTTVGTMQVENERWLAMQGKAPAVPEDAGVFVEAAIQGTKEAIEAVRPQPDVMYRAGEEEARMTIEANDPWEKAGHAIRVPSYAILAVAESMDIYPGPQKALERKLARKTAEEAAERTGKKLARRETTEQAAKGAYKDVAGHHVHAKSAFRGHGTFDPARGFAISEEYMKSRGWSHGLMTGKQHQLYDELAKSGRANTIEEHTRIAYEALMAGGATAKEARELVAESLTDLAKQGVVTPTRIPWH